MEVPTSRRPAHETLQQHNNATQFPMGLQPNPCDQCVALRVDAATNPPTSFWHLKVPILVSVCPPTGQRL